MQALLQQAVALDQRLLSSSLPSSATKQVSPSKTAKSLSRKATSSGKYGHGKASSNKQALQLAAEVADATENAQAKFEHDMALSLQLTRDVAGEAAKLHHVKIVRADSGQSGSMSNAAGLPGDDHIAEVLVASCLLHYAHTVCVCTVSSWCCTPSLPAGNRSQGAVKSACGMRQVACMQGSPQACFAAADLGEQTQMTKPSLHILVETCHSSDNHSDASPLHATCRAVVSHNSNRVPSPGHMTLLLLPVAQRQLLQMPRGCSLQVLPPTPLPPAPAESLDPCQLTD